MTMPWRLDQSNASSPYTGGALDVQTWLSAHQSNASPPTDPWISPWVNSNNFATKSLTSRDKSSIEDYYLARLEDEASPIGTAWKYASDAIFDTLMSGFGNVERLLTSFVKGVLGDEFTEAELEWLPAWFIGDENQPGLIGTIQGLFESLPQWIAPLEPIAEFLADTFTTAFQTTFTNLTSFLSWLWDNGFIELVKNVISLLNGIAVGTGTNIAVPLLTALRDLWQDHGGVLKTIIDAVLEALTPLVSFTDGGVLRTLDQLLEVWTKLIKEVIKVTNLDGFLGAFRVFINGLVGWTDLNSPAVLVLRQLISGLVGLTDFENWVKFFRGLIDRVVAFFMPAGSTTPVASAVGSFQTIVDVFLSFFTTLNQLGNQWINVLKLILEKILALTVPAGQTLLQFAGTFLDVFVKVINAIVSIVIPNGRTLDQWINNLVLFFNKFFGIAQGTVGAWIDGLFTFFNGLGSVSELFITSFKTVFNAIAEISFTGQQTLTLWVNNLIAFVNKFFTATNAQQFINDLFSFISGLGTVGANFVNAFKEFFTIFTTVVGNGQFSLNAFKDIVQKLKILIEALAGGVQAWTNDQFRGIAAALEQFLRQLAGLVTGVNPNDQNFISQITSKITELMKSFGVGVMPLPDFFEFVKVFTGGASPTSVSQAITQAQSFVSTFSVLPSIIPSLLGSWTSTRGTNNTIPDLIEFGFSLLKDNSVLPAQNIFGSLSSDLLSLISAGSIGGSQPNLVSDQAFADAAKLQAGNGWTWDGTTTSPASTGGSAKVVGDGGVKQLFSNLVPVAAGQQLSLSAQAKWTKASASTPTVLVAVRGYNGSTVTFTTTVASVVTKSGFTGPTSTSSYTAGANTTATLASGWVKIAGSFTVPANTTHVRLMLSTQNAPAGSTVWFDDTIMKKTGLIQQTLVGSQSGTSLVDDLLSLLPVSDFTDLIDRIAKKTGATINDVTATIQSFLTGTSPLNGSNIQTGNIGSALISELRDTWFRISSGIAGQPLPAAGLDPMEGALGDFRSTTVNNAGILLKIIANLSIAEDVIDKLVPKVSTLETATKELQDSSTLQLRPAVTELQTGFNQAKQAISEAQSDITKFRTAISELQTGLNTEAKPAITNLQSLHNSGIKPAITELQTGLNSQVKPAVVELQTLHNTKTKVAVDQLQTGVFTTARTTINELQTLHNTKTVTAITELQSAVRALQVKTSTPQTSQTVVTATAQTFGAVTPTGVTTTTSSVPTTSATTVNSTNVTVTTTTGTSVATSTSPTTVTATPTTSVPNTGVTPVANTPVLEKKNYQDDFERSALGSNWLVYTRGVGTLGIPDAHNVKFIQPSGTTESGLSGVCAGVWGGGVTNSSYQVVSTVLTNAPSGTSQSGAMLPSWNDLLALVSSTNPLISLVCRFYADGKIVVFYRQGGWEASSYNPANTIGTFTASPKPTAGSLLEFRVGNPSLSDPTRITVQVGNAAFGPIFVPASALSTMGRRFGFGMGNGLSVDSAGAFVGQPSAALNYIAGRDG